MTSCFRLVVVYGLLFAVARVLGDAGGKWHDPEYFPGEPNKVLVLDYESPFGGQEGRQLSNLLGRLLLSTIEGVKGLRVIILDQDEVHVALTDENIGAVMNTQKAELVIWGEFYMQGDRVFVTSHIRYRPIPNYDGRDFLTVGQDIGGRLDFPGNPPPPVTFSQKAAYAALPTSQINFSPIEISKRDLARLEDAWRKSITLHKQPDEGSTVVGELSLRQSHTLIGSMNGWSHIKINDVPEKSGWARLSDVSQVDHFKDLSALVLYTQGLMQFLDIQNHMQDPMLFWSPNWSAIAKTFQTYLEKFSRSQDRMNEAVARILLGYSLLELEENPTSSLQQFDRAKTLLPNSASPVNFAALAIFAKTNSSSETTREMQQLERDLIHVIQADNDGDAVRNLKNLYELPHAQDYFGVKEGQDFNQARKIQVNALEKLEAQFEPKAVPETSDTTTHMQGGY
jgi:hypothetical protein